MLEIARAEARQIIIHPIILYRLAGSPALSAHGYAPASTAPTSYRGPLDVPALADFTTRLRAASTLPIVSGVGTSTPALAARVAPLVDAVVIGTPVVSALMTAPEQAPLRPPRSPKP
ncbi:hypothetical protein ACFZAG_26675 [Streptomyces sp. NPDC012403]|uniref:hypothetical protein n=1 Tax=Streptomyces TaxID=1883 RepID=UPI00367BB3BF